MSTRSRTTTRTISGSQARNQGTAKRDSRLYRAAKTATVCTDAPTVSGSPVFPTRNGVRALPCRQAFRASIARTFLSELPQQAGKCLAHGRLDQEFFRRGFFAARAEARVNMQFKLEAKLRVLATQAQRGQEKQQGLGRGIFSRALLVAQQVTARARHWQAD